MRDSIAAFAGLIAAQDLQLPVRLPGAYVTATMRPPSSAIMPIASRTATSSAVAFHHVKIALRSGPVGLWERP